MVAKWKSTEDDDKIGGDTVKNDDTEKEKYPNLTENRTRNRNALCFHSKTEEKGVRASKRFCRIVAKGVYVRGL